MKMRLINLAIYTIVFSLTSKSFFGQTPNLGKAVNFALYTEAGEIHNTGATTIWGNIGTNSGAFTGSPTVNGYVYLIDSNTALAVKCVDTAYSYLGSRTCDTTIGTTIGSNQVLRARIYCLGAASTLNGNLYLDANGDTNAVFIFKIDGAFSVNNQAQIILINNALQKNVYWQINGAITLGDSSVFIGTIVANGAISLLNGATLYGRGLTRAGAISLNNNLVSINTLSINLPVKLVSFTAQIYELNSTVVLSWQTALEISSAYFLVERSTDGVSFKTLGKRLAAGNSSQLISYSYVDSSPHEGLNYYRLNQYDKFGAHTYSYILFLSFNTTPTIVNVYPNPFTTYISITTNDVPLFAIGELKIYNVLGTEVMRGMLNNKLNTFSTDNIPSGLYFYQVINNNKVLRSGKIVCKHN